MYMTLNSAADVEWPVFGACRPLRAGAGPGHPGPRPTDPVNVCNAGIWQAASASGARPPAPAVGASHRPRRFPPRSNPSCSHRCQPHRGRDRHSLLLFTTALAPPRSLLHHIIPRESPFSRYHAPEG